MLMTATRGFLSFFTIWVTLQSQTLLWVDNLTCGQTNWILLRKETEYQEGMAQYKFSWIRTSEFALTITLLLNFITRLFLLVEWTSGRHRPSLLAFFLEILWSWCPISPNNFCMNGKRGQTSVNREKNTTKVVAELTKKKSHPSEQTMYIKSNRTWKPRKNTAYYLLQRNQTICSNK